MLAFDFWALFRVVFSVEFLLETSRFVFPKALRLTCVPILLLFSVALRDGVTLLFLELVATLRRGTAS